MRKIIDLGQVSFLVVDDSPFSRSIVRSILRSLGVQPANIHEATDGADAIKALELFKPDIAIVDNMMEPMDGITFTRTIRRREEAPFQTTPVIMLSAFTTADVIAEARDAGANEYVAKPVSTEALYLRIEEVICRPRQFVFAENFCGPDRHRHPDAGYGGPRRRANDKPCQAAGRPSDGPAKRPGKASAKAANQPLLIEA